MAIKPQDNETFLKEVDEELRRERMNSFFARYGWAIIAAVVLLLAAIGGWIWYQQRQEAKAAAQGEMLIEALDEIDAGNRDGARAKIDELAASNIDGYRAAALFARANMQIEGGNNAGAVATLAEIANSGDLAEPYRQAALIRQTALEFDTIDPAEVIRRLSPLARPGEAWLGSAGELVAAAHLKQNRPDRAAPIFEAIAKDETVPASIRTRAVQMASALGVDATEQAVPSAAGAPDAAAPAAPATKE